ncbi:Dolichyl-diphosphooligosaccharide--protein glycosyltransferase subunit dad1 [Tolypocladium ophioglossoides CBS 100239]|uniref:Dolichyl-diphosphooligosaccharide--protein glycosyltransferase subunit OST2 n=1 Tax=Tolypocladium ophioglossoides (strain CBS 100239) TaxID=1163406 RepID=A0A0L0NM68_TOLOC|nr:Dolichyl-diphosphooligosaccharide--protein glycosyltransferase subunit dad1 [Tolypocladium ophioglossoides CBS 100239]
MAPKKNAREPTPSSAATTQARMPTAGSVPPQPKPSSTSAASSTVSKGGAANWDQVLQNIYQYYMKETPQRTKLIDAFLFFLAVVGALQFLYCILAGNYPFNAFLSGFCATVGQFVLTVSLRIQTTEANKSDFPAVSPERAFADFVVCSLILHFFCVNFIN